jgi:lipoate-protein ligase A
MNAISRRRLERLSGKANMSLDAALLERAESAGLAGFRVYGWDGPWVSLGMNQDADRDLLDPQLVPWVRRPTGGKGVLHGHDVTVGMAAPLSLVVRHRSSAAKEWQSGDEEVRARSVRAAYRFMTAHIISALRACGLPATLSEGRRMTLRAPGTLTSLPPPPIPTASGQGEGVARAAPTADCFGAVSPNDVVDERTGMKVCGCALRVTRNAVLLQASIPAGPPLIDPRRVFARPSSIVAPPWDVQRFVDVFAAEMLAIL